MVMLYNLPVVIHIFLTVWLICNTFIFSQNGILISQMQYEVSSFFVISLNCQSDIFQFGVLSLLSFLLQV